MPHFVSFFPSLLKIDENSTAKTIGNIGEDVAAAYLIKHGYRIKERNYRACGHEIDIIAAKGAEIHFIEVKTRRLCENYGYIEHSSECVSHNQFCNIRKCASYYLSGKHRYNEFFFDIIGIDLKKEKNILKIREIEHIIGAFTA